MVPELKDRLAVKTVSYLHMVNPYIESFQPVGNDIPICRIVPIVLGYYLGIRSPRIATENVGVYIANLVDDLP